MMTHNEIVAGLWCLTAGSGFTAGILVASWRRPSRRRLYAEWNAGYDAGSDSGWNAGYALGVDDEARGLAYVYDQDGNEITEVMPAEVPPRYHTGQVEKVPRPGPATEQLPVANEGHPGPGRTIYPELAALAAEPAPDRPADPDPGVDTGWYPRGLHFLADWQAEWHAEAARFDQELAAYLADMKASLEPSWSRASRMLEAL